MRQRYWISIALFAFLSSAVAQDAPEGNAPRRPSAAPATLRSFTVPGRPGETCVILVDAKNVPLARRCTSDRLSG